MEALYVVGAGLSGGLLLQVLMYIEWHTKPDIVDLTSAFTLGMFLGWLFMPIVIVLLLISAPAWLLGKLAARIAKGFS